VSTTLSSRVWAFATPQARLSSVPELLSTHRVVSRHHHCTTQKPQAPRSSQPRRAGTLPQASAATQQ
jgi:hypothetical protein